MGDNDYRPAELDSQTYAGMQPKVFRKEAGNAENLLAKVLSEYKNEKLNQQ